MTYSRELYLTTMLFVLGCAPLTDLDAKGRGRAAAGAGGQAERAGASMTGGAPAAAGATAGSAGDGPSASGANPGYTGGIGGDPGNGRAGSDPQPSDAGLIDASAAGDVGVSSGAAGTANLSDDPLPNDIPNSPVPGDVSFAASSYSGQPSTEISTPTATYTVLNSSGIIISVVDRLSSAQSQWIGFSDYRPARGAGIVTKTAPTVMTTVDQPSVTARHVRLLSVSQAADWRWTWDFYETQATLTISRAPSRYAFVYRGTPGGALDDADRLVLSSGSSQSAKDSFVGVLRGVTAWAYLADPTLGHALFVIQHEHDSSPDRYDSLDGDSATLNFGDDALTRLPNRFSLGLVNASDEPSVEARVNYVISALR